MPFAAFSATVDIIPGSQAFVVYGTFTLGAGGAFNPLTDPLTVTLNAASVTIPGGSFRAYYGRFVFADVLNGELVESILVPLGRGRYVYEVGVAGVPNLPTGNPVTVTLTAGNNTGSMTVTATFVYPSEQ